MAKKTQEIPSYPARQFFRTRLVGAYGLSPEGREAAVVTNLTGVPELWRLRPAGGWPDQLTFDGQSIAQVEYSPDGRHIAFLQDQGGNEQYQVRLLDRAGGEPRTLTAHSDRRHLGLAWSPSSKALYYASNRRNPKYFHIYRYDLATGHETEVFKNDEEGDAGVAAVSEGDRRLFWVVGQTNLRQRLFTLELETGAHRELTPGSECTIHSVQWHEDEGALYFLTNLHSDTHGIARILLSDGSFTWKLKPGRSELASLTMSRDGRSTAWVVNREGYLDLVVERKGRRRVVRPPKTARGVTYGASFSADGKMLALLHSTPVEPHELFVLSVKTRESVRLTRSAVSGIPPQHLVAPKLVRYPSFDGTTVSGFLYLPKRGKAPFPLVVWPHGGPEAQELADYRARHQFWANHGFAVFAPNFRGSTGFGTRFQRMIYRDWGGGHYKDIVAGARELARKGWADPARIGIYGGSFGGYTTLWAITQDPELWKAAVAVVAPSNLRTLIETTHASWRRWAVELIGDPDAEPQLLKDRSPLTFADRVRTPLILFQGANDPRVPKSEADQFAAALKDHGIPCEYVVFDNEGHGWRTLTRVFEEMERSLAFLRKHLADGAPSQPSPAPELAAAAR